MRAKARKVLWLTLLGLAWPAGRLWGYCRLLLWHLRRLSGDRPELLLGQLSTARLGQQLDQAGSTADYLAAARKALEAAGRCPTCHGSGKLYRREVDVDRKGRPIPTWRTTRCGCGAQGD